MSLKHLVYVLLTLVTIASALAFDCTLVSDQEFCESINNEEVYASLLYPESNLPKHDLVLDYNNKLQNIKPKESKYHNSKYIKNAWLSLSWISPSVYVQNDLLVPPITQVQSNYDYKIQLPSNYYGYEYKDESKGDCIRTNHVTSKNSQIKYYLNNLYQNTGDKTLINVNANGIISAELEVSINTKARHYWWEKKWVWWKQKYKYECNYHHTTYDSDTITISDSKDVVLYQKKPTTDIKIVDTYSETAKWDFEVNNFSYFQLDFPDSSLTRQRYTYSVRLEKEPLHVAVLQAKEVDITKVDNLYVDNNTFYLKNINSCVAKVHDHFNAYESECNLTETTQEHPKLEIPKKNINLNILWYVLGFLAVMFVIYKVLKSQAKKIILPILLLLLLMPTALADDGECGITNIGSCISETLETFILAILNAPIAPLLVMVEKLLTADVAIGMFKNIWSIIRYMLSFFYIFFFIYSGYVLLFSSSDPIKRAHAKEMLKNTILMIVLINGSYYLYELLIDISVNVSSVFIDMIDPKFFLLTIDNITNIGLQMLFGFFYTLTLFGTVLFLILRYIIVVLGVMFFPIGIFCYFIPPLKSYGRFIINMHVIMIFIIAIDMLIILACSTLINLDTFANMKILVMIACFQIVNYTLYLAVKFAFKRSTNGSLKDDIGQAAKYIAALL